MAAQADFLLDSDVLIWMLRRRFSTLALVAALKEESGRSLGCSALSVLEVWAGVKKGEEQATAELFAGLDVLAVDGSIGRSAAGLLSSAARRSPRDWVDAVIAATALHHARTLVTYNTRHYPYAGLRLYPMGGSTVP